MEQALSRLNNNVHGVLSPNDGIAGGVIAALKAQHLAGKVVVTGQDATVAGLHDIREGTLAMTVFKRIPEEADIAAQVALGLARGDHGIIAKVARTTVSNSYMDVPSVLLQPVVLTKETEALALV